MMRSHIDYICPQTQLLTLPDPEEGGGGREGGGGGGGGSNHHDSSGSSSHSRANQPGTLRNSGVRECGREGGGNKRSYTD